MRFRRAGLALLLLIACADEEATLPTEPAPEALFAGCQELSETHCTLERPSEVTVWLDVHAATPLRVLIDGESIPSKGRVVQGGVRLEFEVPEGTGTIEVETTEARWDPPVEVAVRWEEAPPMKKGPTASDLRTLAARSTGWQKLRALDTLRRVLNREGDFAEIEVGRQELALARELDALIHKTYVLGTQTLYFVQAGELPRARALLDELEPLTGRSPFAASRWHYYAGLLARRTDDLGSALRHFSEARALYEKLGSSVLDPLEMEAVTLADLGRAEDARVLVQRAYDDDLSASLGCARRVTRANNFGWSQLVLAAADRSIGDPRPTLERGLAAVSDCPAPWDETSILISLGMTEQLEGHSGAALGWLARIVFLDPYLAAWTEEAGARALEELGQGPSLLEKPLPTTDSQLAWNQAVRRGDTFARWGFLDHAIESYRAAEDLLTASTNRVGNDRSAALFLAGRTASMSGLVDALLSQANLEEASCALRLARARELARIDRVSRLEVATAEARDTWSRAAIDISREQREIEDARLSQWGLSSAERAKEEPKLDKRAREVQAKLDHELRKLGIQPTPTRCEDLRRPREGEVILTVYESLAIATHQDGVEATTLDQLGALDSIGGASLISVVEVGERPSVAVHTLPWKDAPSLLDVAPVAYSLDLRNRPAIDQPDRVLVVADPNGNLPLAKEEGEAVQHMLNDQGHQVATLEGEHARRRALLDELATTGLLHYAGHGVREGLSGWDSALLLAQGERLQVADVLTLPGVPEGVVLTGCETAAATPQTIGGGMNIARAFVLSGSSWVIAADTEIPDQLAKEVGVAVHETGPVDGPSRLRNALLALKARDPEAPWQHFRAITP